MSSIQPLSNPAHPRPDKNADRPQPLCKQAAPVIASKYHQSFNLPMSDVTEQEYQPFLFTKLIAAVGGSATSLGALAITKHFTHLGKIPSHALSAGAGLFTASTVGGVAMGVDYCLNSSSRVAAHAKLSPEQKHLRARSWVSYGAGLVSMFGGAPTAILRLIPPVVTALEKGLQQPPPTDPNTGIISNAADNYAASKADEGMFIVVFAAGTVIMSLSFTLGYMLAKYSIKAAHSMQSDPNNEVAMGEFVSV